MSGSSRRRLYRRCCAEADCPPALTDHSSLAINQTLGTGHCTRPGLTPVYMSSDRYIQDHEADYMTNLERTFGNRNTLIKLIEYVQPAHHYTAEQLPYRGIRRVRWVDRMI